MGAPASPLPCLRRRNRQHRLARCVRVANRWWMNWARRAPLARRFLGVVAVPPRRALTIHKAEGPHAAAPAAPSLGWRAAAAPPPPCPRTEGARAWYEPEEARIDRQPRPGVVEGAAAALHRGPLPAAIRQGTPPRAWCRRRK